MTYHCTYDYGSQVSHAAPYRNYIINLYFFCLSGHSVCCNVHGFEPYFYICCPPGMGPDDISHFHQTLEVSGLVLENTFIFFLVFNVERE